ncbi:NAD(P)-binding protein [Rhizophagus irregularis]|uniref:NAD(P)-binding protein n=1 Tax=Rhizophagus irregularis TaxID=588596 RepID=A0A2I1GS63_9GLOM|nr:NAD(P)-binding protein [Rhizophagus irregularis]
MSQERKVIILTGANSGLGFEALKQLIQHSTPYHLILAVRNVAETEKAISALTIPSQHSIEISKLDLSSFTSVKSFAQGLLTRDPILPLNILILNAATVKSKLSTTEDNLETTFQTNHLSYFLLINLLLDRIKWSSEQQNKLESFNSRIIFVNSSLHKPGEGHNKIGPKLEIENLDGSKGYDSMLFYKNTKLAQMLFFYQLNKLLEEEKDEKKKISIFAIEPGFVPQTELARESPSYVKLLMKYILPFASFTRTPEQGGAVIVYAATSPELESKSALYINKFCQIDKSSDDSYKEDLQKLWWNISCDLTGFEEKKLP